MEKEQKEGPNIVKIQVEAKPPARRKPRRRRPVQKPIMPVAQPIIIQQKVRAAHKRRKPKKIKAPKAAIPKVLVDNLVGLQRVQATLAEKLDALAKQIVELLRLFEATAKTFSENPAILTMERDKEFIDKINQLLEQDKVIAKGVVYIEERLTELEKATPLQHHEEIITREIKEEYNQSKVPKPLPKI